MKQYVLITYMVMAAVGGSALIMTTLIDTTGRPPAGTVALQATPQIETQPAEVAVAKASPCTAFPEVPPVGGLENTNVPRLTDAQRLTYGEGGSQYTVRASEPEIFNYYLEEMSDRCWEVSAIGEHEVVWKQGGETVSLAVAERGLGGKTIVQYVGAPTAVLGLKLAQQEGAFLPPPPLPPPPTGDQQMQPPPQPQPMFQPEPMPPTGDQQFQPRQPSQFDSGNFQPQPDPSRQEPDQFRRDSFQNQEPRQAMNCPEGQYICNDRCVPTGSQCNGYKTYEPGENRNKTGEQNMNQPRQPRRQTNNRSKMKEIGEGGEGQEGMRGREDGENINNEDGAREEEMNKKMDEERFKQMKKGLLQFERGYKQMQSMVKKMAANLSKKGVGIPPELTAAMEQAPTVIAKIKAAKTADELETLMDDIQDVGQAMMEWGPKLGDLQRLGEMLGRADKDLTLMKKKIAVLEKAVKKNPASEGAVSELKAQYDGIVAALAEAKGLAGSDPEGALTAIQENFYGGMEEFWNGVAEVDMLQNLTKGIGQAKSQLAKIDSNIKKLQRAKKIDADEAAELKDMVAGVREALAEVQRLAKDKTTDVDTLRSAAEELWSSFEELEDKMGEFGQSQYQPNVQSGKGYNFELPQGFDFRSSGGGEGAPVDGGFGGGSF